MTSCLFYETKFDRKPDISALTETWLGERHVKDYKIDKYQPIGTKSWLNCKSKSSEDKTTLYVKENIIQNHILHDWN